MQKQPCRRCAAALIGTAIGLLAGHIVIDRIFGAVSVVDGTSMEPTYEPGACVYTAPISSSLQRGDIVLLDDGQKDYALKRILGLPGETVHLWRGYVFINRKMLRETYLPAYTYTFPDERVRKCCFELGKDEYFVLGDNRLCSVDSRRYGPVSRRQIKSRVPASPAATPTVFAAYTLPLAGKRTIRPLVVGTVPF